MFHIKLRRFALCFAAVSFGCLGCVLLIFSACSAQRPTPVFTQPTCPQPAARLELALPLEVESASVRILRLASYDGPFYEDGSGEQVMNVAAVLIENTGLSMLSVVELELTVGGESYCFTANMVPPCARVLVPERNKSPYTDEGIVACRGWCAVAADMPVYTIRITPVSMGELRFSNFSDQPITQLSVYHRSYLPEADIYVGGVAFETVVAYIPPKSFTQIQPGFYAYGYSEIVYIS